MAEKIDTLDKRLTEVRDVLGGRITDSKADLTSRITESKADLTSRIGELKSHTDFRFAQVDTQIVSSATGIKELFLSELRAFRAEILAALPPRARGAGTNR
ncbi:MAG TPA: hypothetical protein VGG97_21655 [Bryobacteraceae bacterium]